jgi:hypothetical protein
LICGLSTKVALCGFAVCESSFAIFGLQNSAKTYFFSAQNQQKRFNHKVENKTT